MKRLLIVALIVAGCGLSDAESLWCDNEGLYVSRAAENLGIEYETRDKGDGNWVRACKAAYELREEFP